MTPPFLLIFATALAAGGCTPKSSAGPSAPPSPAATEQNVHETRPDIRVPGHEVVIVDAMDGGPARGELRAGSAVKTGADAFLTAVAAMGNAEPSQLAILAASFVDPAGASILPWKPGDPVLGAGAPAAPSRNGPVLTYFRAHRQRPEMVRVEVNLGTGAATVSTLGAEGVVASGDVAAILKAREAAAGTNVDLIQAAFAQAAMVNDPAAGAFFAEFLRTDPRVFLRKAAVEVVGQHKTAGGQMALAAALSGDGNAEVRKAAARALESWGSPTEARAALEKAAAEDADPVVRAIAARALGSMR